MEDETNEVVIEVEGDNDSELAEESADDFLPVEDPRKWGRGERGGSHQFPKRPS